MTIFVFSTVYLDTDQRKHQSSAGAGNSPEAGEFPAQLASKAENVFIDDIFMNIMTWLDRLNDAYINEFSQNLGYDLINLLGNASLIAGS